MTKRPNSIIALALAIACIATGSLAFTADADARKRRHTVTVTPKPNPAVTALIRQGVQPDVARMIVASRVQTADGSPFVPNATMYEWRQKLDTLSGVPQGVSGSTLRNPWVDRTSPAVRHAAGLRH